MTVDAPPSASRSRPHRIAAIGHGGMADLYVAAAPAANGGFELVAIKELRPALAHDPEFVAMFQREARIAARLSHPNVVRTREVGGEDGRPYLVMDFIEGQSLHRILRRLRHGLPMAMHLRILADMLAGLHYAHDLCDDEGRPLGLVHRDVSPHNVLVTFDGEVRLVDFGIVRIGSESDTKIGTFKGKASYSSPEQARGVDIDRRSDVFSAGVMLWEALAGARMWGQLDELVIARRLAAGELPPLPAGAGTPALRALCGAALAVARDERLPTARALHDGLEAALATLSGGSRQELGALLARTFRDERAALHAVIEATMRRAGAASLPLDLSEESRSTPEGSWSASDPDEPTRPDRPSPGRGPAESRKDREDSTLSATGLTRRPRPAWRWPALLPGVAAVALGGWLFFETGAPTPEDEADTGGPREVELSGEIERPARLTRDKVYRLKSLTVVRPGASLSIEAGTTILGDRDTRGTLLVQPGAELVAEGTPELPIVFTSSAPPGERRPGDWGGLLLLGRAPTNMRDAHGKPLQARVEGITLAGEFGGDDPEDSSGVLRYVRVEYAGVELGPNNETNGITFAGVGRGTQVDSVQVRHPADDCFEFFGGTVDARRLLCEDPGDDGFDWDLGFTGRLQFLVLRSHSPAQAACAGLEGDSDPTGARVPPRSHPTIFNATLCGGGASGPHEHHAVLLRRGTAATLGNLLIAGFDSPLDVRDHGTEIELRGALRLDAPAPHERPDGKGPLADDDEGFDEAARLAAAGARIEAQDLPGCEGPRGRFKPEAPMTATTGAPPADGFFEDVSYAGAFRDESDAWDQGWSVWDDSPGLSGH